VKSDNVVLIVDDNLETISELRTRLADAGLAVETAGESLAAIEKLRTNRYPAIVLEPMIRHGLNGFAVLNYIELEQPETLSHVFLLTAMSRQTITRTAPGLIPRFFRRPREVQLAAAAVIASIERQSVRERPKRSVLLVEDDSQTARVTSDALEQLGYTCEWLPGGGKVLETVSASRFDAIMLDLIMPDVDGFAVLECLKSRKPELLRRVVVTTGMPAKYLNAIDDAIDRSRICGVVQKPVDFGQLRHLLHRCAEVTLFEAGGESPIAG
jgi:CheY-like chemotaxis protein